MTLNRRRATDPARTKKLGSAQVRDERLARAKLTRLEVDTLMMRAVEDRAGAEARGIFRSARHSDCRGRAEQVGGRPTSGRKTGFGPPSWVTYLAMQVSAVSGVQTSRPV
jgi:hypothetical protein